MAITDVIASRVTEKVLTHSLSGKPKDLKLLARAARYVKGPGTRAFMQSFARDLETGTGLFPQIFLRAGQLANPTAKRKLVKNLVCRWGLEGPKIRAELREKGTWAPSLIVISPSMRCNLRCTGCYSGLYEKEGELSEQEIEKILDEARSFGSYFVVVSGGEPYVHRDMWLRLFRKYDDMFFMTYTNGTLLDQATVDELARLGNVAPAISVEGFQEETDGRRGPGVHEKVCAAMERLHKAGVIFGISATYTRQNVSVVASEKFVRYYLEKGALFGWYFMFMPVGKDPILDLVPTPEQRVECGRRVAELRAKFPIFLADFWNDGPAVGGCLAGGRMYLHIVSSGSIEVCVFAHFGVDNIREKTILEAVNSDFFKSIRGQFPYNDNANLRRPCMILDNPEVLRSAVNEHIVKGHEHSEDIVRDPRVVAWVDDYAERFRALVDPVWEKEISDPKNRWYRENPEYKALFSLRTARRRAPQRKETGGSISAAD
ncbi:MAG TPA: radical SAM protein [Spirochaetia bacterium]